MKVSQQRGHLLLGESSREPRHQSPAGKNILPYRGIRRWNAAGQCLAFKEPMQIWRNFLQRQIVLLVAMRAAHLVEVLAFRLLLREHR